MTLKDSLYSNMCKRYKIYVELNDSTERSDLSYTEIQKIIEKTIILTICSNMFVFFIAPRFQPQGSPSGNRVWRK